VEKIACDKSHALDCEILEYYSISSSLPYRYQKTELYRFRKCSSQIQRLAYLAEKLKSEVEGAKSKYS
jgi:hypothetical protein